MRSQKKKRNLNFFNTSNSSFTQVKSGGMPLCEVGSVEEQSHRYTTKSSSDGNGHDPSRHEQADTLPVDSLVGSIAEADADGGAGDAHGGRDGEGELREDEDGDGGAHFHAAAARGRVVGDLVTHDYEGC
jgi:hypothetical protein